MRPSSTRRTGCPTKRATSTATGGEVTAGGETPTATGGEVTAGGETPTASGGEVPADVAGHGRRV
jgi:hypothetical protein